MNNIRKSLIIIITTLCVFACSKSKDEPAVNPSAEPSAEPSANPSEDPSAEPSADPYDFSGLTPNLSSDGKFITTIFEFRPAPGQFANENYPKYEAGNTDADMRLKVLDAIGGEKRGLVSLGSFGGYVTFGFGHSVINHEGKDFMIYGNALYGNKKVTPYLGSCEPGVVYVSIDKNGNGLPDDEWFVLAGSQYDISTHNHTVTYYRTPADHVPTPGSPAFRTDTTLVKWVDGNGVTGYVEQNSFHTANHYYPDWYADDQITFTSELLPSNIYTNGSSVALQAVEWGYADVHPNDSINRNAFDINWARNSEGKKIALPFIDFVRIATGVLQQAGMMGDTSTEVAGARIIDAEEAKQLPLYLGQQ